MSEAYQVRRAAADPAELFRARDGAWQPAQMIEWGSAPFATRFRALWTMAALWMRFDAADVRPWGTLRERDARLWNEEVVEIFLDPDRFGGPYAELEISPFNVVCDLRVSQPWPGLHSDPAWHFDGLVTAVVPWTDREAGPDGWSAVAAIPWHGFRTLPVTAMLPPRSGDRWTFNVFRIKRPFGAERPDEAVVYAAWSPTGGPSFHVPSAFRDLVFVE